MAFLLAPLVAEAGAFIGAATSEIFGSAVGTAVGGAAVAEANKAINKKVKQAAYDASVKMFGQDSIDKATSQFNKYSNQAYNTFLYGNPMGNDSVLKSLSRGPKTSGINQGTSSMPDNSVKIVIGGLFDLNGLSSQTDNNDKNGTAKSNEESEDQDLTHAQVANDVARIVTDHAALLANNMSPIDAITKVIKKPTDHLIIGKMYDHYDKYVPNDEDFLVIQKHVSEHALNYPLINVNRTRNGILYYSWFDEDLAPKKMMQNLGPVIWPAFPGYYFCGPNSPNNPERIEDISPFDSLCCLHDESWSNGSFNYEGDLFFIARLHNWLSTGKIGPNETSLAKKTLIYFSSLGKSFSLLTGSGNNVRHKFDQGSKNEGLVSGNDIISKTNPLATDEEKSEFFTHLNESIVRESNDSLRDMSQDLLREKFLNIEI